MLILYCLRHALRDDAPDYSGIQLLDDYSVIRKLT